MPALSQFVEQLLRGEGGSRTHSCDCLKGCLLSATTDLDQNFGSPMVMPHDWFAVRGVGTKGLGASFLAMPRSPPSPSTATRGVPDVGEEWRLPMTQRKTAASFMTQVERRRQMETEAVEERLKQHKQELDKVQTLENDEAERLKTRTRELKTVEKHKKGFFESASKLEKQKSDLKKDIEAASKDLQKKHQASQVKKEAVKEDEHDLEEARRIQEEAKRHAEQLKSDIELTEQEKQKMGVQQAPLDRDDCGCIREGDYKSGWNPATFECDQKVKAQAFHNDVCGFMSSGPRTMKPVEVSFENGFLKVKPDKLATSGKPLLIIMATHEKPPSTDDARPPMPDLGTG